MEHMNSNGNQPLLIEFDSRLEQKRTRKEPENRDSYRISESSHQGEGRRKIDTYRLGPPQELPLIRKERAQKKAQKGKRVEILLPAALRESSLSSLLPDSERKAESPCALSRAQRR